MTINPTPKTEDRASHLADQSTSPTFLAAQGSLTLQAMTDPAPAAPTTQISFVAAIPALAVSDVPRAVAFFADVLGFDAIHVQGDYGIARRDAVEVHFWAATGPEGSGAEPRLAGTTSCRVRVDGITALYEQCQAQQVVHPNGELHEQPWGTREFTILDPDRNAVTFFQAT
jgi:catechol 2,3-dioxygenase-like lactoylglutathione lyase family enzyme